MRVLRLAPALLLLGACSATGGGGPPASAKPADEPHAAPRDTTATEGTIDPKTLAHPWRRDYDRCVVQAGELYEVRSFMLVRTRDGGAYRFLYFHNPDEMSSESHFACRIDKKSGEVHLLHEG